MWMRISRCSVGFRKGRGTRDQIANICWIIEKAREFQKNIYFCSIDYAKLFDCVDHNKLWKILKELEIPDHLTCLLWNCLQVKKQQLELDMEQQTGSKSGKEYVKSPSILSPCLFNLMWNAGLDEAQAGIRSARRNINNLRYADDTTLLAKSEEGLKSYLISVKEESEKAGFLNGHEFEQALGDSDGQGRLMHCSPCSFKESDITEWLNHKWLLTITVACYITIHTNLLSRFFTNVPGRQVHDNSVQFSRVAQSCLTLCNRMNRSMPGLPVHHQLTEFTQTHVHRVSDVIQPSHPLSSPSPPARNPSQHQGLFQRVNTLHEVAKVLEFQI